MMESRNVEIVIGLEVHIQLRTARKIFGPEGFDYRAGPNRQVSALTMAHPGALPVLNQAAVLAALRLGLACGCQIAPELRFDRKHYFYPDLPKGYQLTQDTLPICGGGAIPFFDHQQQRQTLELHHIHLEEDAGRSLHDQEPGYTLIDLNRAGVPLLEMVTQPGLHHPEDAAAFLAQVRRLVRVLEIGDGNMEEGNLRCDANISLRYPDGRPATERVEIKNLNSFQFLEKALRYEVQRQTQEIAAGRPVKRETRSWDAGAGITLSMRSKEQAADYRYLPEPDLPPIPLIPEDVEALAKDQPELPWQKQERYLAAPLSYDQTEVLIEDADLGTYFEKVCQQVAPRLAANWVLGPVRGWLNAHNQVVNAFPIPAGKLGTVIALVEEGVITHHQAKTQVFEQLLSQPQSHLPDLIAAINKRQTTAEDTLAAAMQQLMTDHPAEVKRYRQGKKNLQGWFVGALMKQFRGQADPKQVNAIVRELLEGDD